MSRPMVIAGYECPGCGEHYGPEVDPFITDYGDPECPECHGNMIDVWRYEDERNSGRLE